MEFKKEALIGEIKETIMDMWDAHDRLQMETITKAEVDAWVRKVEGWCSSFKVRMEVREKELEAKVAELEAAAEAEGADS